MPEKNIFDLMDDMTAELHRQEAAKRIAQMPEGEKLFMLGLFGFMEKHEGQAGVQSVVDWVATRKDEPLA